MEDGINRNTKVNFIGIGVQKSATSWLFRCLREHPEIQFARKKELNFFNHNYEKGYYWYHQRFAFGQWKTGEYSPRYFHDKNVPERIYRYSPNVKLILSLRNPIERAFSQHKHEIMRNRIPESLYDFDKALEQNSTYIEQGRYATHLERYLDFFDLGQILIVFFDDIIMKPQEVLRQLYSFLGIEICFRPAVLGNRVNVARISRNRFLNRVWKKGSKSILELLGESAHKTIKATGIPAFLRRRNEVQVDEQLAPPLSEEMRMYLKDLFKEEIERCSNLIKREFPHWG